MSFLATVVEMIFGISWPAMIGFIVIMFAELVSGIKASQVRKEQFQSARLKRFSFRIFQYMVLMAVPYLFQVSFRDRGNSVAAGCFEWLQVFLIVQIVFENVISILENKAVIDGNDKTHLINKLKAKLDSLF